MALTWITLWQVRTFMVPLWEVVRLCEVRLRVNKVFLFVINSVQISRVWKHGLWASQGQTCVNRLPARAAGLYVWPQLPYTVSVWRCKTHVMKSFAFLKVGRSDLSLWCQHPLTNEEPGPFAVFKTDRVLSTTTECTIQILICQTLHQRFL